MQPRPRRRLRLVLMVAAAVILVGGASAGAVAFFALRGSPEAIDQMVPATASVYVTAYLDPAASQKLNLRRLIGKFPGLRRPQDLTRRIDALLDDALRDVGLTSKDVRPWVGSQIALTVRIRSGQPAAAVLIASRDDDLARAALDKARRESTKHGTTWREQAHGGVTISVGTESGRPSDAQAIVDHTVVLGNDAGLIEDIIDTSNGELPSLGASANFARTMAPLPTARLVAVYVDVRPLVSQLEGTLAGSGVDPAQLSSGLAELQALRGLGATISAEPTGIATDVIVSVDPSRMTEERRDLLSAPSHRNTVLDFTPANAYGFFTITNFGQTMRSFVETIAASGDEEFARLDGRVGLTEAVGHLTGDAGLEAGPGGVYPSGAFVAAIDDEAAMQAFLDRVAEEVRRGLGGPGGEFPRTGVPEWQRDTYGDATISFLALPELERFGVTPAYAVSGGALIIGSSPDAVKSVLDARQAGPNVTSAGNFRAALGSQPIQNDGMEYLDIEAIAAAIREALPPEGQQQFDAEAGPILEPMKSFVFVSTHAKGSISFRMFLLIR